LAPTSAVRSAWSMVTPADSNSHPKFREGPVGFGWPAPCAEGLQL
jgi:hypothetical protein